MDLLNLLQGSFAFFTFALPFVCSIDDIEDLSYLYL
jgi:hypothetical protein